MRNYLTFHNIGADGIPGTEDDLIYEEEGPRTWPRIWGDKVVCKRQGANPDVTVYELGPDGAPVDSFSLGKPHVGETTIYEDLVVLSDGRNGDEDIYLYDLGTGEETLIAGGRKEDIEPEIHGSRIVWVERERKPPNRWIYNIYVHDSLAGDSYKLTSSGKGHNANVYEDHIVYADTRNDVTDIYLFILDSGGAPPPPGVMHVDDIDMSLKQTGPWTNAIAKVKIVDESDAPVPQATVEGHWSGLTSDSDVFETGSNGVGECSSDKLKNPSGWFIFTVDTVCKEDWEYDSLANVETSDSIPVGGGGQSAGIGSAQPQVFTLSQSCPDPFSQKTTISLTLPASGHTTLQVCDISGRVVETLVDGKVAAGCHQVTWETGNATSGIYFYRLTAGDMNATRKFVVLK